MIGELLMGVPQMVMGYKQMKELSKIKRPELSVSPELQKSYNRAESMAQYGLSPQERASMEADAQRNQATQLRTGYARTGGSMAGALGVISGSSLNDFTLGLGKMDQQMRRQNIQYADRLMGQIDSVRMMQQKLAIERDQDRRNAASNLFNMGGQNIAQGFSDAEGLALQLYGMGTFDKGASKGMAGGSGGGYGNRAGGYGSVPSWAGKSTTGGFGNISLIDYQNSSIFN